MFSFRKTRLWLIFAILVITLLTFTRLNETMWSDENRSLIYAGAAPHYGPTTLIESVERIAENLWQAPAYYVFLWGWGRIAGWSVFALRIPSVFFGILSVAVTYRLGRYYFSNRTSFYSAFVLAFSAFFLNFMHDMRTYTLITLLTALMLWLYVHITTHENHYNFWCVPFAFIIALSLYSHYFTIFPIAALGLYHLSTQFRQSHYVPTLIAFVIGGVLFLPWIQVLINGAELATEVPRQVLNLDAIGIGYNILYFFGNGSIALSLLLVINAFSEKLNKISFFAIFTVTSLGLLWFVTRLIPALTDVKYLIFIWVSVALIIGAGIQQINKHGISAKWILLVWLILFFYSIFNEEQQQRIHPWYIAPYQTLVNVLDSYILEDDVLLFIGPEKDDFVENPILSYYFYETGIQSTHVIRDTYAMSDEVYVGQAQQAITDASRIWLTYDAKNPNWRSTFIEETILSSSDFSYCGTVASNDEVYAALYMRPSESTEKIDFYSPDQTSAQIRIPPKVLDAIYQPYIIDLFFDFYDYVPYLEINNQQRRRGISQYLWYLSAKQDHNKTADIELSFLSNAVINPDNQLQMLIGWHTTEKIATGSYSIAIHIKNEKQQLIAQEDMAVGDVGFNCAVTHIDLTGLAKDEYKLQALVYNWQTSDRLVSSNQQEGIQSPRNNTFLFE